MTPKSSKAAGKTTTSTASSSKYIDYAAALTEQARGFPDIPGEFTEFIEKTQLAIRLWGRREHSHSDDLCHEILRVTDIPIEFSSWANLVIALNAQSPCLLEHAERAVRLHYHLRGAYPEYSPYANRFELAKKILGLAKCDFADHTARQKEKEKEKENDVSGGNKKIVEWKKVRVYGAFAAMEAGGNPVFPWMYPQ